MKRTYLIFGAMSLFCALSAMPVAAQDNSQSNAQPEPYAPGEGISLTGKNNYNIRLSGILQPMVETRSYPEMSEQAATQRFRMRRMITKLTGNAANEKIRYQLQVDLTGSSDGGGDAGTNNYLMDAWISYRPVKQIEFTFGQETSPTDGREMGMLSNGLQMIERSPVALAFASIREFGVIVETKFKLGKGMALHPTLSVSNGDGANVGRKDHGGLKVGGRLDFLPFGTFSNGGQYTQVDMERELTPKLVIGITGSHNYGISDRRGRESGSILYLDSLNQESLPSYTKVGADLLFKYRGFSLLAEYVNATASVPTDITQRVRNDGTTSKALLVNGIQDVDAYVKGRIMLGSGYNVQAGYLFLNGYGIDGRYARLMPAANSFLNNPTFYNRSEYFTLCASKYLGRHFGAKIQASVTYTKAEVGSRTVLDTPQRGNEVSGLLMLTIAL
jgi:hypothetical protein